MAMDTAPVATRQVDVAAIRRLLDRIVARWNPQQVWLFGSRARGDSTPESDWDLFVVVDDSTEDDELDPGEDLAGARQLSATGNRNAMYLCSQAAEKIIRAVLPSEGKNAVSSTSSTSSST